MKPIDMKTMPWYIDLKGATPTEREAARQWLQSKGLSIRFADGKWIRYLTNTHTGVFTIPRNYVLWGDESMRIQPRMKEIKLKFETKSIVHSVEYPQVETEAEIKIRELEETINKAKEQITQLKGL